MNIEFIFYDDIIEEEIVSSETPLEEILLLKGEPGDQGKDGVSPELTETKTEDGYDIEITDATGTRTISLKDGDQGPEGPQGQPGYTPVKGVDYFTEEDKRELLSGVEEDIAELDKTKADKTEIPDVSSFIDKDVNNLTHYTLKTATGSLIDLEINQSTYVVTLSLKDIDGNVISTDTIDLPLESVVIGGTFDSVNKKIVLTLENGNTVDIPVGDLVAGLQTEITSQNKLASDLVDDTNSGNKFVTTSEKTAWNAKYDKPSGGIPKTDLASDVQTSLGKADTALQEHQSLADYVKNTDYATTSKGGVFKTQPNYATNMYQGFLYANAKSYADYLNASPGMFIGKQTLENVITGKQLISQTTLDESQAEQDAKIEELNENNFDFDTASGENIAITDSARYPFKEFNVEGNTKQATAILPDEYQQVDYIESSGTQYIDTGVATSNNMKVQAKAISTFGLNNGTLNYSACLFGARKSVSNSSFFYNSGANNDFLGNGSTYLQITKNTSSSMLNIENSNNSVKIVGGTYTYTNDEININITAPLNIYIFARNEDGTVGNNGTYKLYSFKMYENNSLVRNFVPCYRKSDNVVGLYDLVNNVFYTNAGTGEFTYGAVVTLPNPDFPIEVENVSGEVEVKVENKNIYNSSLAVNNMYQNYNNPYWSMSPNNSYWCIGLQKIKPNTNYTISRTPNITVCYDKDRNPIPQGLRGATITTQATAYYMNCCYVKNSFPFGSNLQIEEGSTATSYEPHEEQTATFPLAEGQVLHIGDTLEDDGIHQRRFTKVFDGTEDWKAHNTISSWFYVDNIMNFFTDNNKNDFALCTHFIQEKYSNVLNITNGKFSLGLSSDNINKRAVFKCDDFLTVEEWKAFLVQQYANGTPVKLELKLTNLTIIPYTAEQQTAYENLKNLYSYKGTTYISNNSEPSLIFEIEYAKDSYLPNALTALTDKIYAYVQDSIDKSINDAIGGSY